MGWRPKGTRIVDMKSIKEFKYKGISKVGCSYHMWNTKWRGTNLINFKAFPAKQLLGYFSSQPASLVLFSLRAGFRKCMKLISSLIVLFIQVTDMDGCDRFNFCLSGGSILAESPHWVQREISSAFLSSPPFLLRARPLLCKHPGPFHFSLTVRETYNSSYG